MADTIEKVEAQGCLIDEATFKALFSRLCRLEGVSTKLWSGNFNQPDIHADNQPINIDETRSDAGWSKAGINGMQFTGSPDHVQIVGHHVAENDGSHWAHPHIRVFRNDIEIAEGAVIHMDNSVSYSGRATINISFIDPEPGVDPLYTFVSFVDDNRTMDNPTIVELSPLTLKAFCTDGQLENSGGTQTGPSLGTPAGDQLRSFNFQDGNGNAPFNLQVAVNGNGPTNWQAVTPPVPYATIPDLQAGPYTLETFDNGDGAYTHVFTGTQPLTNFTNLEIRGGVPSPAGQGGSGNIEFFIP